MYNVYYTLVYKHLRNPKFAFPLRYLYLYFKPSTILNYEAFRFIFC